MTTEKIISQLDHYQVKLFVRERTHDGVAVVPASPGVLAENLLLIRGLLIQLVDKVAEAELDYRKSKASRYHQFIGEQPGDAKPMSKSAANDAIDLEVDLVDKKIATERLRNYMKYTDGLCTSIQSVLRVQAGSDKNQY